MKISVILGHPYKKSFNHAIAETVVNTLTENNHQVFFHDLYAEQFDPVMKKEELETDVSIDDLVIKHCEEIKEVDGIIIIHPNWWGQPPAILKGWVDRVLRNEIAYSYVRGGRGNGLPFGLLKAQTGLVFNTSNTPTDRENSLFGDPLETLWKTCVFGFCDIQKVDRKTFSVVVESTPEQRAQWLKDSRQLVGKYFPKG